MTLSSPPASSCHQPRPLWLKGNIKDICNRTQNPARDTVINIMIWNCQCCCLFCHCYCQYYQFTSFNSFLLCVLVAKSSFNGVLVEWSSLINAISLYDTTIHIFILILLWSHHSSLWSKSFTYKKWWPQLLEECLQQLSSTRPLLLPDRR